MEQKIPLVKDTIDNKDIDRLINWLKTYPRLTKGEVTIELETNWAKWLGTKHAVFVNSGSSANLMMLYALVAAGKLKNNKVVVPSLAWATDMAPVLQLNLQPLVCDINLQNLAVDINHLEEIFKKENPAALMLVSVLGFPPHMKEIISLCEKYSVILLEDNCESLGTKYNQTILGNFGLMSSFSLYFGHHISTIEGGMICTNSDEMFRILKMIRSHGWDRDLNDNEQKQLREQSKVNDFDALYTFYIPGFNLRSTDLQAYIGLGQLEKLNLICEQRNLNYQLYRKLLSPKLWSPQIDETHFVSNFCYPIIHEQRNKIVYELRKANIEVRPLICGSMGTQPMYANQYGRLELPNATKVDKEGCYIPNNHQLTAEEIARVCNVINTVVD